MSAKSFINIFFILFLSAKYAMAQLPCWKAIGLPSGKESTTFDSTEQGEMLKKLALSNPKCDFIGITWIIDLSKHGGHGKEYSLLLWDIKTNNLTRIKVHTLVGARWERWSSVTTDSIKSEDMSDGFDFQGYVTGRGKLKLSPEAMKFIKMHKPDAELIAELQEAEQAASHNR
jgi:hypothetical protein